MKTIPRDELESKIKEIKGEFGGRTEEILAEIVRLDGRMGVPHRTLRDWIYFISDVIFNKEEYPEYSNFKYGTNDAKAIIRWAALYLIYTKETLTKPP